MLYSSLLVAVGLAYMLLGSMYSWSRSVAGSNSRIARIVAVLLAAGVCAVGSGIAIHELRILHQIDELHQQLHVDAKLNKSLNTIGVVSYNSTTLFDPASNPDIVIEWFVAKASPVATRFKASELAGSQPGPENTTTTTIPISALAAKFRDAGRVPPLPENSKVADMSQIKSVSVTVVDSRSPPQIPARIILAINNDPAAAFFSAAPASIKGNSAIYDDGDNVGHRIEHWLKPHKRVKGARTAYGVLWIGGAALLVGSAALMSLHLRKVSLLPFILAAWQAMRLRALEEVTDTAVPKSLRKWDRILAIGSIVALIVAFHVSTNMNVKWYYSTRMPHFDSVGSYTAMAHYAHIAREEGLPAGLHFARNFHHTWLQSIGSVIVSVFGAKRPEDFQIINSFCIACIVIATYRLCCSLGFARSKSILASLIILLPDALTNWDGGLQDMKAEAQMLPLLVAMLMLLFTWYWRGNLIDSMLLAIVGSAALWSRGNSAPYVLIYLGSASAVVMADLVLRRAGIVSLCLRSLIPISIAAIPVSCNIYHVVAPVYARYSDQINHYGKGYSGWDSLATYIQAPLFLYWTNSSPYGATTTTGWLGAVSALVIVLAALILSGGRVQFSRLLSQRQLQLGMASVLACGGTLYLICFILGWDPRFGPVGFPPLYPTMVFPVVLSIAVVSIFPTHSALSRKGVFVQYAVVLSAIAIVIVLQSERMKEKARPEEKEIVEFSRRLAADAHSKYPDAKWSFLTHDRLNFHSLRFFEAQLGYSPSRHFSEVRYTLPDDKAKNLRDTASVIPETYGISTIQNIFLETIRKEAQFLVVNRDCESYGRPDSAWPFFIFRHGKPVVESLLNDERFEQMSEYEIKQGEARTRFVILRNRSLLPGYHLQGSTPEITEKGAVSEVK